MRPKPAAIIYFFTEKFFCPDVPLTPHSCFGDIPPCHRRRDINAHLMCNTYYKHIALHAKPQVIISKSGAVFAKECGGIGKSLLI